MACRTRMGKIGKATKVSVSKSKICWMRRIHDKSNQTLIDQFCTGRISGQGSSRLIIPSPPNWLLGGPKPIHQPDLSQPLTPLRIQISNLVQGSAEVGRRTSPCCTPPPVCHHHRRELIGGNGKRPNAGASGAKQSVLLPS